MIFDRRTDRAQQLSDELDEAIEQQHFARCRLRDACAEVSRARMALMIEEGRTIEAAL